MTTAAGNAAPTSTSSRAPMLALCGRAERRGLAESGAAQAFARLFAEAIGKAVETEPSDGSAALDFSHLSGLPDVSSERLWDGRIERLAAVAVYGPAAVQLVFDAVESLPALEVEAPEEALVRGLPLIVLADGGAAPEAEAEILARAETDSVMCALSLEDAARRCGLPCRCDDARPARSAGEGRRRRAQGLDLVPVRLRREGVLHDRLRRRPRALEDRPPDGRVYVDAGTMEQSCYLAAAALGLAGCVRASFDHDELRRAMKLPEHLEPIVLFTAGRPA